MTSKERVYKTLAFDGPDKIPVDIWTLRSAERVHGRAIRDMIDEKRPDIVSLPLNDPTENPQKYEAGTFTDVWGSEWHNAQYGIIGEVKAYPLADDEAIDDYRSPVSLLRENRAAMTAGAAGFIAENSDRFILSGWNSLFERMQYIRGTENLFMDIAVESDEFFKLRDIVLEYCCEYAQICAGIEGADGCVIGDDWGSQLSSLISPDAWVKLFKPAYKQIIDIIKGRGKKVFLHSDGNILSFYDHWLELGVDAVNSQLLCMGTDKVAQKIKGKMTVWGELDRQHIMPDGTAAEVQQLIDTIKTTFYCNGGVIGQFETNSDMPLANIRKGIFGWE